MSTSTQTIFDPQYPGTAMERLQNVHARVRELVESNVFVDQPWESIRKKILWAGGLRDLPNAAPGNVRFFFLIKRVKNIRFPIMQAII
jgi:hypothetical protein